MRVKSYGNHPRVSALFHRASRPQGSSMLSQVQEGPSFLRLKKKHCVSPFVHRQVLRLSFLSFLTEGLLGVGTGAGTWLQGWEMGRHLDLGSPGALCGQTRRVGVWPSRKDTSIRCCYLWRWGRGSCVDGEEEPWGGFAVSFMLLVEGRSEADLHFWSKLFG